MEASWSGNQAEIVFASGAETVTLRFATSGTVAGHVQITSRGQTLVSRPLTSAVMPQAGLAAAGHAFRTKEEINAEISQPMRGARRVLSHDPPRVLPSRRGYE